MMAAEATDDAVERAKLLPELGVGLHLVLVDGHPRLSASEIPALVDENGQFSKQLVSAGFRFFFIPSVRRQLAMEIRAQFQAFKDTGLHLDHVNTHRIHRARLDLNFIARPLLDARLRWAQESGYEGN